MSKSKPAVEIRGLSKAYMIGHEQEAMAGTMTFRDSLTNLVRKPAELLTGHQLKKEEFWALKKISLDIEKGDTIGLIGRNGSGKSTLLKVLSRIVEPTQGEAILHGRVASLLEVGTGFHPELTGRENIYFNGAILGMGRREIQAKFQDIVEFSGVEKFLDTPVKFYSSGMYVRLAFAIAAHLDPDILIVDEVLAVGDAEFQRKSLGKMRDVTQDSQRTVIFVSHSMDAIQSICNKCLWLQGGKIVEFGNTKDVVASYMRSQVSLGEESLAKRTDRKGNGEVKLIKANIKSQIEKTKDLTVELDVENSTKTTFRDAKLSLDIYDTSGNHISNVLNYTISKKLAYKPGKSKFTIKISNINLVPGSYFVNAFLASDSYNTVLFDWVEGIGSFTVGPYDYYDVGTPPTFNGRFIYLDYDIEA